jgi:secretion/DNA translocation related TadE-like protein
VTPVVAAAAATALVFTMGVADLGAVLAARSRARSAADAAALAAAQELALPARAHPAELARAYAEANGAELVACACEPGALEARVEVRVPVGALLLLPDDLRAVARARAVIDLAS